MAKPKKKHNPDDRPSSFRFRQFFLRGLATLLPTVLTLWLLVIAWNFLNNNIAQPINAGVRQVIVNTTPFPMVLEEDILEHEDALNRNTNSPSYTTYRALRNDSERQRRFLVADARRAALDRCWGKYDYGLDLIGLVVALILVYTVGAMAGSYIGKSLYHRGERFITNLPLIRKVYPAFKQVTDFFVGEKSESMNFSRVVAVEYPRKGLLSLGLVTGDTMRDMQDYIGQECLTVFIPSSPTPFTGYVITVPKKDTVDVPIPIDEALRFTVSGGVSIPDSQRIFHELDARDDPTKDADPTKGKGKGKGDSNGDGSDHDDQNDSPEQDAATLTTSNN